MTLSLVVVAALIKEFSLWLVWNQDLAIPPRTQLGDLSARRKVSDARFLSHALVRTPSPPKDRVKLSH